MISKSLRIFLSILLFITLFSFSSSISYASGPSVSISLSKSTVNVGDTVTVTMTFRTPNIAAVQGSFNFNTDILQHVTSQVNQFSLVNVSGGTGTLVLLEPQGAASITVTSTFKALKTGSVNFRVSGDVFNIDETPLGNVSAGATITVATPPPHPPPPPPPPPSQPTQPSPPPPPPPPREPEPEPHNPVDDAIKITLNEEELFMWVELKTVKLPDGFKITTVEYNGEDVEMATSESTGLILAYLTDEEGKNGRFFVFNSTNNKLHPYITFNARNTFTFLWADSSVVIPDGYVEVELTINDHIVQAWQKESGENPDFYLVYALNSEGEKGLYYFDSVENTLQRFFDKTVIVEVEIEPEEQTFFERLAADSALMGLVVILSLLNISLLGLATVVLHKNKKLKKNKPYIPTE